MKKHSLIPLLAMVLMLAVGAAYSQLGTADHLKVNIPFSFTASQVTFPAGEYTVKNSGSYGVLLISRADQKQHELIGTNGVEGNNVSGKTKLIFHRYGDSYFLSQIWVSGNKSGRELPRTKVEKELMARGPAAVTVILAQK
jgi:hypothetical protein